MPFVSEEIAKYFPNRDRATPDGGWSRPRGSGWVDRLQTNLVKPADAPTSYATCSIRRWAGKSVLKGIPRL